MMRHAVPQPATADKPALGLTMFGVTTPCVQAVTRALEADYDCLVFHATGTGGRADGEAGRQRPGRRRDRRHHDRGRRFPGRRRAAPARRTGSAPSPAPACPMSARSAPATWSISAALDTVPERFRDRNLYVHNPQITLMRTTAEENAAIGRWIGDASGRLPRARCASSCPRAASRLIDAPGKPFHDPEADAALFAGDRGDAAATREPAPRAAALRRSTTRSSPRPWSRAYREVAA